MNNYYLRLVFFEGNTYRMENWTSCCNFITFCQDFLFFFFWVLCMWVCFYYYFWINYCTQMLYISQDIIIYPCLKIELFIHHFPWIHLVWQMSMGFNLKRNYNALENINFKMFFLRCTLWIKAMRLKYWINLWY